MLVVIIHKLVNTFQNTREAVIWIAVEHGDKKALEIFGREIAPAGTGMGLLFPN